MSGCADIHPAYLPISRNDVARSSMCGGSWCTRWNSERSTVSSSYGTYRAMARMAYMAASTPSHPATLPGAAAPAAPARAMAAVHTPSSSCSRAAIMRSTSRQPATSQHTSSTSATS